MPLLQTEGSCLRLLSQIYPFEFPSAYTPTAQDDGSSVAPSLPALASKTLRWLQVGMGGTPA